MTDVEHFNSAPDPMVVLSGEPFVDTDGRIKKLVDGRLLLGVHTSYESQYLSTVDLGAPLPAQPTQSFENETAQEIHLVTPESGPQTYKMKVSIQSTGNGPIPQDLLRFLHGNAVPRASQPVMSQQQRSISETLPRSLGYSSYVEQGAPSDFMPEPNVKDSDEYDGKNPHKKKRRFSLKSGHIDWRVVGAVSAVAITVAAINGIRTSEDGPRVHKICTSIGSVITKQLVGIDMAQPCINNNFVGDILNPQNVLGIR